MNDKRNDGSDHTEAEELENNDASASVTDDEQSQANSSPSGSDAKDVKVAENKEQISEANNEDDEDEDGDEDDEDEDGDEDEDDEDEDDEDEDEDDEDEDDEDEDDEPKKAKASSKVVAKSAPAKSSLNKKAAKPITKMPSEIPLPPRNNEIVTGLVVAIGGYIAFWLGWSIYSSSIEQKNVNFFSNSAWAFLVAYFLIAVAATFFVRFERRDPKDEKNKKPKLERQGLLLASLVCGPFYVAYWWKGIELWEKMYAQERPGMWVIFVAFFAFVTFGIGYGLRPPSENEELQRRIPGRRVLLMVMTPFAIVYGMIYLAAFYPPWP